MSLLTARTTAVTKTSHVTAIAFGLVAVPLVALATAAYGPAVVHLFHQVFLSVGNGSSKISDLPLDVAFAAIVGVIVVAIGMALRERRADEDQELHDIR